MKQFFTPVKLLLVTGIVATGVLVSTLAFAQKGDDKAKHKIEKRIEVTEENGEKKVTVTTIENGNKKVETYTGEKAEEYMNNQEMGGNGGMHMGFNFDFDTLDGKSSFDFNMNGFGEELDKELQKMADELQKSGMNMNFDFNNMFKSMDTSFSNMGNNFKMYKYQFDKNDLKDLDSLLKGAFNFNFDMQVDEDETDDNKSSGPHKKRIIIAHSVVIEDMDKKKNAEKELHVSDLSFYPNPGGGNFTLRYKSESLDMIDISVLDMGGKTVYNERISATGTVLRNIELDQPAGVYILNLKQGKKQVSKKLVIE
jgi:hypothetical protein